MILDQFHVNQNPDHFYLIKAIPVLYEPKHELKLAETWKKKLIYRSSSSGTHVFTNFSWVHSVSTSNGAPLSESWPYQYFSCLITACQCKSSFQTGRAPLLYIKHQPVTKILKWPEALVVRKKHKALHIYKWMDSIN